MSDSANCGSDYEKWGPVTLCKCLTARTSNKFCIVQNYREKRLSFTSLWAKL